MKPTRLSIVGLLLASGALFLAGLATAYAELRSFADGGTTPASRFAVLVEANSGWAPSLLSRRLLLDSCLEAINGPYGRLQPADTRRLVLEHCRASADAVVGETPSYAFGWFIGALAAATLGDVEGFNARIKNVQITAPTEQWMAELRVGLVEDNHAHAAPDVLTRHDADLRLLVHSPRGIQSIAARYAREPEFKSRITAIVETMPEADQARFVAEVRQAVARTGSIR